MQTKPNQTGSEICSIRIIFPVNSDEQAIECKKKVQAALADMPEAQIHFTLMPKPPAGLQR